MASEQTTVDIADPQPKPRNGGRRTPWRLISHWISKKMPKGLYARSLIAIIAPMVLLQSVIAFVFMERHWQTVTQRLSQSVTADISAIIDVIKSYPQDQKYEMINRIARENLGLNATVLPPDPFPVAVAAKTYV